MDFPVGRYRQQADMSKSEAEEVAVLETIAGKEAETNEA